MTKRLVVIDDDPAPDLLLRHQHRRAPRDRHVSGCSAGTALRARTDPTGPAEVAVCGGLDQQHELVPVGRGSEQTEPVESEKQAGQSGNVVHACGLCDGVLDTAILVRPQAAFEASIASLEGHPPPLRSSRRAGFGFVLRAGRDSRNPGPPDP